MTISALFHQTAASINALDFREIIKGYAGGKSGILNVGSFSGSAISTTSFRVTAGSAVLTHTSADSGVFYIRNDANIDKTINAPASGTKYVTVYIKLLDVTLGDASNTSSIELREETTATYGVPAGQSGLELYRIIIPTGTTLLSGSTITNSRVYAKPWNVPWGFMTKKIGTANTTFGATGVGLTGTEVSINTPGNRLIKLTGIGAFTMTLGNYGIICRAGRVASGVFTPKSSNGHIFNMHPTIESSCIAVGTDTPPAGNQSYCLQAATWYAGEAATGTSLFNAALEYPMLLIEDIGPAAL